MSNIKIIQNFINEYYLYKNDPLGLKSRMPIDFIKEYVNDCQLDWDVVLYNGQGEEQFIVDSVEVTRQTRKVKRKHSYYEIANRQLSRANPEAIVMPKEYKNISSREMRAKMKKPLLMLHALELIDEGNNKHLAVGFGVSFPQLRETKTRTIKVRINKVYLKQLEQFYKEEVGDDFVYDE